MGVPSVFSSKTPERICTSSRSFLGDTISLCPGRLLSSSRCISDDESFNPAGHPSTTTPSAGPCDSPHVVMRNNCPKLFPGIYIRQLYLQLTFKSASHFL